MAARTELASGGPAARLAAAAPGAAAEPGAERDLWSALGAGRHVPFLIWLAIFSAIGALLTSYRYLEARADLEDIPFLDPLINEMSSAIGAGLLFWAVRALCLRYPLSAGPRLERLGLYALALLLFSILHTTWNWIARLTLFPLAGLGPYDYGAMPTRYAMELGMDAVAFSAMVLFIHGWQRLKLARGRELRAAQLESSLARAELQNLRLQLQPHFLFNALNTISSTMYENPAAADEMIGRLAELLRASLRQGPADELPLASELELLGAYLAILEARFGDRLAVEIAVDEACRRVAVPAMLLQPLVENAIRHGRAEAEGRGRVRIAARRRGDPDGPRLELEVENDLPANGLPEKPARPAEGGGIGLASVSERLRLLHPGNHHFFAGRDGGGEAGFFRVTLMLPWRELP